MATEIVKHESSTCRHENIMISNGGNVICIDCATHINKAYFEYMKKRGIQTDNFYHYKRTDKK